MIAKYQNDIDGLESAIMRNPDALIGHETDEVCGLRHHFASGVYGREATIPAGMAAVGHRHRRENLNLVLGGRAIVVCEGQEPKEVSAPAVFVSPANCRKAVIAIEDFTIVNVLATEETDPERIEEWAVEKSEDFENMLGLIEQAKALAGGDT